MEHSLGHFRQLAPRENAADCPRFPRRWNLSSEISRTTTYVLDTAAAAQQEAAHGIF